MIRMSGAEYDKLNGGAQNSDGKRHLYKQYIKKRADKNQPNIVRSMRELGYMVHHLHEVGGGVYDLIVSKGGLNIFCEVKDGERPPSERKLTGPQERFNFSWTGMRCVLTCTDDCISLNEQVKDILNRAREAGISFSVIGCQNQQYQPRLY